MAIILNIDSSLECATVSIADNGILLKCETNIVQKEHASFIHVAIKKILNELNISIKNIDAVACTIGPGSYTGIRVCLSAAKGLCYALNKPLITIGTLEAMAKTAILEFSNTAPMLYCPMIDARRMEVFTALYDQNLTEIITAFAAIVNNEFIEQYLTKNKIIFFGNGMDKFKAINTSLNSSFLSISNIAHAICLLSHIKFNNQKFGAISSSAPLYVKEFYSH